MSKEYAAALLVQGKRALFQIGDEIALSPNVEAAIEAFMDWLETVVEDAT